MRAKPFSGKKKKQQLQEKRVKKQEQDGSSSDFDEVTLTDYRKERPLYFLFLASCLIRLGLSLNGKHERLLQNPSQMKIRSTLHR